MCSVDPEGKWRWYLKSEYGVLTIAYLLQLGISLGAVQTRHSLTRTRLAWRRAKRRGVCLRSAIAAKACAVARSLKRLASRRRSPNSEVDIDPHTASVLEFETRLQAAVEKETSEPHNWAPHIATPPAGEQSLRNHGNESGYETLESVWEDLQESAQQEAGRTSWSTAATLAQWEKRQLFLHYQRERRGKRSSRQHASRFCNSASPSAPATAGHVLRPLSTRTQPIRTVQYSTAAPSIPPIPLAVLERELLTQLLNDYAECVRITHAEAVDMKLLKLFVRQAVALHAHKAQRKSEHKHKESATDTDDDSNENVFVLSQTDTSYGKCLQEKKPTAVTYADAVRLTTLLGEAIAWESYKLHASRRAQQEAMALLDATGADDGSVSHLQGAATLVAPSLTSSGRGMRLNATGATAWAAASMKKVDGVRTVVQADCIALMLPNSVEYNLIWWSISRSGPLKTFLTDLYDGPVFTQSIVEPQRRREVEGAAFATKGPFARGFLKLRRALCPGGLATTSMSTTAHTRHAGAGKDMQDPDVAVYRPCRTALINTNLSSNAMLYHALACSGCHAIIMDPQFVPLLFVSEEGPGGDLTGTHTNSHGINSCSLRLNVPPLVQRVFLWRWDGAFTASFTQEMKALLDELNCHADKYLPDALNTRVRPISATVSPYNRPLSGLNNTATVAAATASNNAEAATGVTRDTSMEEETDGTSSTGESTVSVAHPASVHYCVHGSSSSSTTDTPHLDLFDLVKEEYHTATMSQSMDENQSRFPLLLARMLRHPPRWLHCDPAQWTPRGTPTSTSLAIIPESHSMAFPCPVQVVMDGGVGVQANEAAAAAAATPSLSPTAVSVGNTMDTPGSQVNGSGRTSATHVLLARIYIHSVNTALLKTRQLAWGNTRGQTASNTSEVDDYVTQGPKRAQGTTTVEVPSRAVFLQRTAAMERVLAQQQAQFNQRIVAALSRFTHTQPVLFIYTSGTTGLPKAARFSHLRFFATAFLSKVLRCREKTAEVTRRQIAARRRFTDALARVMHEEERASAECEDGQRSAVKRSMKAPLPLTASCDEDTHRRKTALDVILILSFQFIALWVTIVLWLLNLLSYARHMQRVLRRHYYTLTGRATAWQVWCEEEAAVEEELSRMTIYNTLPMYHTVGCVFCLGHLMHALEVQQAAQIRARRERQIGSRPIARLPTARMVIRTKFSASKFVEDMQRYHVTVVQYIGEILRYAVLYERIHAPTPALVESILQKELVALRRDKNAGSTCDSEEAAKRVDLIADSTVDTTAAEPNESTPPQQRLRHLLPALKNEKDVLRLLNLLGRWKVPYAFGNGLRLDIWQESKERLSYAQPVEFYSSTEGNIFLFNLFDIPGAVGHIPRFPAPLNWLLDMSYFPMFPFRVVRYDEDTRQVWRNPRTQFCKVVGVGEAGEVIGEIIEGFDMFALRRFDGYHQEQPADIASLLTANNTVGVGGCGHGGPAGNAHANAAATVINVGDVESKKKIIRHVMWPYANDAYFRSGDLVKLDDFGFVSFVDRVGETFRWKGENVSTLEVSHALSTVHTCTIGVQEAVVYGVPVEGREGRAGMAMITLCRRFLGQYTEDAGAAAVKDGDGAHRRPTRAQERLFMQNDLYPFLCGRRRLNGDGTAAQSALPAYATPLFVRVEDAAEDEAETAGSAKEAYRHDSNRNSRDISGAKNGTALGEPAAAAADEAVRTTTFKYRKAVLTRQGYAQAPPSTIDHENEWGNDDAEADCNSEKGDQAPSSRFYVLITKPDVWQQLSRPPTDAAEVPAGYVPLTARAIRLIGEHFEGCGW